MSSEVQNPPLEVPPSFLRHLESVALHTPSSVSGPPITPFQLLASELAHLASIPKVDPYNISSTDYINSPSNVPEDYVNSHMARNQGPTTPATVPKVKAKTGGRRGRGGRRSTIKIGPRENPTTELNSGDFVGLTPDGAGRGQGKGRGRGGGRPRVRPVGGSGKGTKRKRAQSEDVVIKDDTDASETFTPLPTQSRSGRRIFKASTFAPVTIDLETPTPAKASSRTGIMGTADPGKKVKKRYRKPGDASVCKNCGRGHSPVGNMIVFCDGCNTPWHQYCHDKPIGAEVVQIEEKEWFCADCTVLRQERAHLEGNVSAENMSAVEKRNYLQSLSSSHLVSLLLHATTLHPSLPIFSAAQIHPMASAPLANPPAPALGSAANPITGNDDDSYDLYSESDPLPYPKAGNGIPLPPEEDDLAFLIDDDVVTFSHCWNWDRHELFAGKRTHGGYQMACGGTMVDVGD